jgi:hypothetical protein
MKCFSLIDLFLQVPLNEWIGVLNKLDATLNIIISKYKSSVSSVIDEFGNSGVGVISFSNEDREMVRSILDFTVHLMFHTYNKDIYNSTEVCRSLLMMLLFPLSFSLCASFVIF